MSPAYRDLDDARAQARARARSSMSNAKPSRRCSAASRRASVPSRSLKPHCVSESRVSPSSRMARLKTRPSTSRGSGCRFTMSSRRRPREPTARSAPEDARLSSSSMGVARSASEMSTRSPALANTPARTAAPLPRLLGSRTTRKSTPSGTANDCASATVLSRDPSSATIISAGNQRWVVVKKAATRASVPGSLASSSKAGMTTDKRGGPVTGTLPP